MLNAERLWLVAETHRISAMPAGIQFHIESLVTLS